MIPYVKKHQFWFTFFPATHILIFSTLYFLLNVTPSPHSTSSMTCQKTTKTSSKLLAASWFYFTR